jgi:hypothetical protein
MEEASSPVSARPGVMSLSRIIRFRSESRNN